MRLGEIPLAQPRHLGQGADEGTLAILVKRDGIATPGIPVEVIFSDGSVAEGVTDAAGEHSILYGFDRLGTAVIRITSPSDVYPVDDINIDLQGGLREAVFLMHTIAPPGVEDRTRSIVAGLATVALLTMFGASV